MSTGDRPQSALNLRLALASFGLVCTIVLGVIALRYENFALAVLSVILAAITITDLVAIQLRRRRRRRREGPGSEHSIFE